MEALVSIFLMSIVFLGIFGGFQLSIKISSHTKANMQGVYLANQVLEEIRNMSYSDIITNQTTTTINGVEYILQTLVELFDDCADGTIEGVDCDNQVVAIDTAPDDYKKIKVIVTWLDNFGGELIISSYVSSNKIETGEDKGAIRINLVNSSGQPIEILSGDQLAPCDSDSINIINDGYFYNQCFGADSGTRLLVVDESIESDDYKLIINKEGYSREETFQSGDLYDGIVISAPDRKNPTINEGELYPITFILDETSDLNITTALSWNGDDFFDTFLDNNHVLNINNLTIENGEVGLTEITPISYYSSGYLESAEIIPTTMTEWYELRFNDQEDVDMGINYQIYSEAGIIPDVDLPGNSLGFDSSPIDLSSLDIISYPKIKIRGNFLTADNSKTPILYDWQILWKNGSTIALSSVNFDVRGNKTVGMDELEVPIYKYTDNLTTNGSGVLSFTELDTDNYYFSNFSRYGTPLDINTDLSPMPFALLSGESTSTILYIEAENSLLVKVYDSETLLPLFGSELNFTRMSYDETLITNELGEAVFVPLSIGSGYNLNVQLPDYYEQDILVSISGDNLQTIYLERYE